MEKTKNLLLGILILSISLGILFFNPNDEKIEGSIRIGVSDDTSAFVINYMENKNYFEDVKIDSLIESYSIADC